MSEQLVWLITGAGRGVGGDLATDEPSHIHVPRRRRVVRPAVGDGAAWSASVRDEAPREVPSDTSTEEARDLAAAIPDAA